MVACAFSERFAGETKRTQRKSALIYVGSGKPIFMLIRTKFGDLASFFREIWHGDGAEYPFHLTNGHFFSV